MKGSCLLACSTGFRDCNAKATDGCEAELAWDGNNCGACSVDCKSAGCTNGVCGNTVPTVLSYDWAVDLAIDSTALYWTGFFQSDGVRKLPLGMMMVQSLVTNPPNTPSTIALDSTTVFWLADKGFTAGLYKVGKMGGMPSLVASGTSSSRDVVTDDTSVYWSTADGVIWKSKKDGSTTTKLAANQGNGRNSIALDDTSVYWTTTAAVMKVGKLGGTATPITSIGGDAIAVDSQYVYWTTGFSGKIMKVATSGGVPTAIASGQKYPSAIVVDSQNIYWTNSNGGIAMGSVMKTSLNGGPRTQLASAQTDPHSLVANDTSVYWLTDANTVVTTLK